MANYQDLTGTKAKGQSWAYMLPKKKTKFTTVILTLRSKFDGKKIICWIFPTFKISIFISDGKNMVFFRDA